MMLGRVDEVDGNFVATKFIALIPAGSFYVTSKGHGPTGSVALRLSLKSVVVGYGRVWAPVAALGTMTADALRGGIHVASAVLAGVLLIGCVLAHRAGGIDEDEKARRRLLGSVTGLRIDPAMLTSAMREAKRASLEELMKKAGIPANPDEIVSLLDEIPLPALPLVYGYARYAGDDARWQDCAARVYDRHEQGVF